MPVKVSIPLATNLRLEAKRITISRVLTADAFKDVVRLQHGLVAEAPGAHAVDLPHRVPEVRRLEAHAAHVDDEARFSRGMRALSYN